MVGKKLGQARAARNSRRKSEAQIGGFTGLEGDFEAERRRATEAAHENTGPHEDDSFDKSVFPDSTSGLTHP
ncbi:hypothetical protein E3O62_07920 [Cryobacterium sp. TMT2-15-1]|uniref:hypothetical protein n=1 Tax=Cryobacterium sp. TMT2-15-1 TaxID=1259246 RepID=UPI00106DBF2C|nr:hypothetical protein [Cryobacterium sp. TMT2-15-1]TFC60598.1 hypothetical protein E3O62_07920 [Cryobacterium sp. TMT2-15-1]